MENQNARKFDLKRINKIFALVAFICVFIFTACFGVPQVKQNVMWWGIAFAITAVVLAIVWITVYFVLKKKNETENDKNIKKILKDKKDDIK